MSKELFIQASIKYAIGLILVGALVFVPAGSLAFINGWIFMAVLFMPMLIVGVVLMMQNPQLLKRRLNWKEKEREQGVLVTLSGLMFFAGFIVAGLNFRFGWHGLPKGIVIGATIVFLVAYALYAEVLRENTYLSRVIEVQKNQTVIDTGLYGIVRHPMYAITLVLFLAMPLILGSVYAFLIFLTYPVIIIKRIMNEEKVLQQELAGYQEYKKKVPYRLIPFVW